MGGYGTLRYAMTHADVFGAAYSISTGFPSFSRPEGWLYLGEDRAVFLDEPNAGNDLASVQTPSDIHGRLRILVFGWVSGFSPNLDHPALFVDLPFELPNLETVPEVREKWLEHDPFTLLEDHAAELTSLSGFAFDVGDGDASLGVNQAFHQALVAAGVPHQFEVFSGGHSNRLDERIEKALVFLSQTLVVCDFDGDGLCSTSDLNAMLAVGPVAPGVPAAGNEEFDLTGDGMIDNEDVDEWLDRSAADQGFGSPYKRSDANLDGTVDGQDFILWNAGKFTQTLLWDGGDFNGDGINDGLDFVLWNQKQVHVVGWCRGRA